METTYTDLRAGERLDIVVEFITRQSVDCEGGRVHRLIVEDTMGEQFAVLIPPGSSPPWDLKTGSEYRVTKLLGADPVNRAGKSDVNCPECDGRLRAGQIIDTVGPTAVEGAGEFELDSTFGIADDETTVRRVQDNGIVDDWRPMDTGDTVTPPEYVCESCGQQFDRRDLQVARGDRSAEQVEHMEMNAELSTASMSPETVGLATGGAKDVGNFRENVANGFTPQPEAISDEGLFYDYYFETGDRSDSDALFAPRYAAAVSDHPLDGTTERYLSVGLDSTLSVSEFERPSLNLVAVLDISGSMDNPFDEYYYDEHGRKQETGTDSATKLDAAVQSLCALTEQLQPEDRLGVVLFNHRAHVAKPLRDVETTDMPAIRRHIQQIRADGGTNLADGFEAAVDMLMESESPTSVEQRVVFMTDMMPNTGATEDRELTELFGEAAIDGIHTTFIGMGLDANADLAETLSGIRGANHYFIHSASEFERRLGEEFDYMVTPLVYDLTLELRSDGYEIDEVHGSPSADADTGRLMHVGTLFPSAKEDDEARGGVVLARLEQISEDADLELVASWTERNGGEHIERASVTLPEEPESFVHDGVRKAVALARYARELRAWASDVHERADTSTGVDDWLLPDQRGQHERESVPLLVPEQYAERFGALQEYLAAEMDALGDDTLQQEVDLLTTLREEAPRTLQEVTE
jgi:Ca-activated chloride channel family protein